MRKIPIDEMEEDELDWIQCSKCKGWVHQFCDEYLTKRKSKTLPDSFIYNCPRDRT